MEVYRMTNHQLKRTGAVFILIITLFAPIKAHAYIDPNTGGFFFTSVLPFVYGLLAAVVIFWKRIANSVKNFFTRKKDSSDS